MRSDIDATFELSVVGGLDEVSAEDWNALAGDENPFVRYEHLHALETEDCVGERTGWFPRHILVHQNKQLVGAMPAYLKNNSYGEFVFDWAFADAYERAGLDYYPKLVCAVPFTPATGPRLLAKPGPEENKIRDHLLAAALAYADREKLSSAHWLFPQRDHHESLCELGLVSRIGYQFHWENRGYESFEDFLGTLTHKRRKEIRRERRDVTDTNLEVEVLWGDETQEHHWAAFHHFYEAIYDRKWGFPSLTLEFFLRIAETMPEQVMLTLAKNGSRYVAGTYSLCGLNTLFGRNWGAIERHRGLHFELCYYRHIEVAIERGLSKLEAGAQGEHKISRGFLPIATHSAHWFADRRFRDAIADFLVQEDQQVRGYLDAAGSHSPFKDENA